MRALSIRQPWAWLIVNGFKDVENRTWETAYRGPVLIHAGRRMDEGYEGKDDWDWPHVMRPLRFDMGGIVGEAEIVGCVRASESPWFSGPHGFLLRHAKPLPLMPCLGKLGFFEPDLSPAAPRPRASATTPRQGTLLL